MQAKAHSIRSRPRRPHRWLRPIRLRLIVRSLSIRKEKSGRLRDANLRLMNIKPIAQSPQQTVHIIFMVRIVVYILIVPGLRFCRNVGEVLARIVYTLAFKAP